MNRIVDPYLLARRHERLEAHTPVSEFHRLLESLADDDGTVQWQADFSEQTDPVGRRVTQLNLRAQTCLHVPCVRCLEPLGHEISVAHTFRLVSDEALAARLDEKIDDPDVIAADPHFDLTALIEDELIMATPLMPRHETCPAATQEQKGLLITDPDDPDQSPGGERQYPFADLASQLAPPKPTSDDAPDEDQPDDREP